MDLKEKLKEAQVKHQETINQLEQLQQYALCQLGAINQLTALINEQEQVQSDEGKER